MSIVWLFTPGPVRLKEMWHTAIRCYEGRHQECQWPDTEIGYQEWARCSCPCHEEDNRAER